MSRLISWIRSFSVLLCRVRAELRKIVWPGGREVLLVTSAVALVIVGVTLFLWGLDKILLWLVGLVIGLRF